MLRKFCSFVVAKNTHWRGKHWTLWPYAGLYSSVCLEMNALKDSTVERLYSLSSPSSMSHWPLTCSMDSLLPTSPLEKELLYHLIPSFLMSVVFPMPSGPESVRA